MQQDGQSELELKYELKYKLLLEMELRTEIEFFQNEITLVHTPPSFSQLLTTNM